MSLYFTPSFSPLRLFSFLAAGGEDTSIREGGRWNRDSGYQSTVMCIVDTHVTHSRHTQQYHHLPSLLHAGKAPCTVPSGDESVFHALKCSPLTFCFFLGPGLFPTASAATSSTSSHPASSPVLHHTSYHLTIFVSTSVPYTLCLVTSPPSATRHHA